MRRTFRRTPAKCCTSTPPGRVWSRPRVDDGVAAPAQPLSTSPNFPNVFLGDRQLAILYNGLAPGFAGVWQLDVAIPKDAPTGPAIVLSVVNGIAANPIPVAVVRE